MQLSKRTLDILKNYSNINEGIVIKTGNVISTVSGTKSVLAIAKIDESFENQAAFANLNILLSVLDKSSPEADFTEKSVVIKSKYGKDTIKYASPEVIVTPSDQMETKLSKLKAVLKFELNKDQLDNVLSKANIMGLPHIVVLPEDGNVILRAIDRENSSTNTSDVIVGEYSEDADFRFFFLRDNFKMLPDSYEVSVYKENVAKFASKTQDLTYFVALEAKGSYYKAG